MTSEATVVALGESLVRLSVPAHGRLEHTDILEFHVGGAEMNTLIGLGGLGARARWVTRLADNPLGRRIAAHASAYGIDPVVHWEPAARAPLYFVEHGVDPRPSEVLYDRGHTAMCSLRPGEFDWAALVDGADAVYTTGITCALGPAAPAAVREMFDHARGVNLLTVFDVNHRARLWTWDQACASLAGVLPAVDVLLASRHDLQRLLAVDSDDDTALARHAIDRFGHRLVVIRGTETLPGRRARVTATGVTSEVVETSTWYEAEVVDAFGAGDAAAAAFLYVWLHTRNLASALDAAAWACAHQQTFPGDAWQVRPGDLTERAPTARRILR